MRFYEFAQPNHLILKINQHAQQQLVNKGTEQLDFLCNECATRKPIKNAFQSYGSSKRRMDTGA